MEELSQGAVIGAPAPVTGPINLTQNEIALILDGLSSLPLAKSYGLFTKLAKLSGIKIAMPDEVSAMTQGEGNGTA